MFSGLASYFGFGAGEEEQTEGEQPTRRVSPPRACKKSRVEPESDDEWMLVNKSSRGNSPLRLVATNPLENLLIEHPSMSVYDSRGRPSSTGHHSDISESSNDVEMAAASCSTPFTSKGKTKGAVKSLPPRRPKAIAARAGLLAQVQSTRSMQKSQKKKEGRKISKKNLERGNRVQLVHSSPKSHSRKQYMRRPSGVSNDRKTNC